MQLGSVVQTTTDSSGSIFHTSRHDFDNNTSLTTNQRANHSPQRTNHSPSTKSRRFFHTDAKASKVTPCSPSSEDAEVVFVNGVKQSNSFIGTEENAFIGTEENGFHSHALNERDWSLPHSTTNIPWEPISQSHEANDETNIPVTTNHSHHNRPVTLESASESQESSSMDDKPDDAQQDEYHTLSIDHDTEQKFIEHPGMEHVYGDGTIQMIDPVTGQPVGSPIYDAATAQMRRRSDISPDERPGRITWSDEHGLPLAEVHYSDCLHYSEPMDYDEDGSSTPCCCIM